MEADQIEVLGQFESSEVTTAGNVAPYRPI